VRCFRTDVAFQPAKWIDDGNLIPRNFPEQDSWLASIKCHELNRSVRASDLHARRN